jgi:hypothetical protein
MCMRRSAQGTLLKAQVGATMTPRREGIGWVVLKPLGLRGVGAVLYGRCVALG